MIHMTNIAKRSFAAWEKLTLKKYNKVTRKHEEVTMKEIKKGN
jgi:ribosomal protein L33